MGVFLQCAPIFAIGVLLFAVFLFVKKLMRPKKKKKYDYALPNGMEVGNTQLIGQKENQNDYFATVYGGDAVFSVIADGLTNKRIGKFASVVAIEILKHNFKNRLYEKIGIRGFFLESIRMINERLNDNIYGNKVGAALIGVVVEKGFLHFASVGNCSLFLYRNGEIININDIHSAEMQISKITLMQSDVAMLCSKGACESLTEREISWHLSQRNHPYDKCQDLAGRIREKGLGHQDNATIIILEKMV